MEQLVLYVLQLENGKYYVGKSANPSARYKQHKDGKGAAWTQKYKPVKFVGTRPLNSEHDENNLTKDLMKTHGVNNVRGGSYTKIVLDDSVRAVIEMELAGNADKCYTCGCAGHFARRCPLKDVLAEEEEDEEEDDEEDDEEEDDEEEDVCSTCGRNSHTSGGCYARTHLDGSTL